MELASLAGRVATRGLRLRGGFHPEPGDRVPPLPDGGVAGTVVLIGSIGSSLWGAFSGAPEAVDGQPHPLDRWTRRVIAAIAGEVGATPLFPFGDAPYLPFQRWAMRAEAVAPSPLGILIHPDYGLWHAYRGALAFADRLPLPAFVSRPRPCDSCRDRPCLTACPVNAFTAGGYDVPVCIGHIRSAPGEPCLTAGCLARRACPIGADLAYVPAQARVHMAAFLAANRHG
jgi:hypothetical protein